MDRTAFELCIDQALKELPEEIQEQLKEVAIVVEEHPRMHGRGLLLGLYEGIPLTAWGRGHAQKLPDKITLFMESILTVARTPEEIPHIIKETLLHEIAHYFGYDHDHIHEMERRWREKRK